MKVEAAENGRAEPKKAPAPEPQLQEPTEEEREQREAEFEEQLRMRVVRSDLIGRDRHFRRYWWLQGTSCYPHPAVPSSLSHTLIQSNFQHTNTILRMPYCPGDTRMDPSRLHRAYACRAGDATCMAAYTKPAMRAM